LLNEPEGAETLTTIRQSFMEAADWLEWLLKLGKSPERLRLLGDMAQELARLSSGEERTEQLNRAAHYYDLAYERSNFQDAGAALSWATLRYLLIGSQEEVAEHKADLLKLINECERVAKLQTQREATLASQLNVVYAMLLRHLIEGDLPKQAGAIADQYRALLTRPSSAAAALDRQLAFLIDMLAGKRRTTLVRPLETIQAVVEPYALG
jgi:hypothetical protein